jgi:hypothetical protein
MQEQENGKQGKQGKTGKQGGKQGRRFIFLTQGRECPIFLDT